MRILPLPSREFILIINILIAFALSATAGPKEDFDKVMSLFWQHEKFIKAGEEFIATHPDDTDLIAEMNLQVGWGHWWLRKYKEARPYFQEAIDLTPNNRQRSAQAAAAIGWMYLLEGNYDKAIEKLEEQIVKYDPLYRDAAQIHLADAYMRKRDYVTAAKLYKYILERAALPGYETRYLEALKKRAQCQIIIRDYENALVSTKLYLCLAKPDARTYIYTIENILRLMKKRGDDIRRAIDYIKYQRYGKAGEDRQIGTQDDLNDPIISDRIMYDPTIAKERDGTEKIQHGSVDGYIERGNLHLFLGEPDPAIADYRKAILLSPPWPKTRKQIIANISKAVMLQTGSISTLNKYLKYLRYGHAKVDGTDNGFHNPLEGLESSRITQRERMLLDNSSLDKLISQTDEVITCLDLMLSLSKATSLSDEKSASKVPAYIRRMRANQPLYQLSNLIDSSAGPISLHLNTGRFYVRRQEYDKAFQTYIKLLENITFPKNSLQQIDFAISEIARLNEIQKNGRDVMEVWREILSKRANDEMGPPLLEHIVKYLTKIHQENAGRTLQIWCAKEFPNAPLALTAIDKLPPSETLYRQIAENRRNTRAGAEAIRRLGNLIYEKDNYTKAITAYENFLKTDYHYKNQKSVLLRLADSYEKTGDHDKAINAYKNAIKLTHDETERILILKRIAGIYERQMRYADAIEICKQIIENYPSVKVSPIALKLGIYLSTGKTTKKPQANEYPADAAKFWLRYIVLHTPPTKSQKSIESSLNWLSDFISKYPESSEALMADYELADYYQRKGDMRKAQEYMSAVAKAYPEVEEIAELFIEMKEARKKYGEIDAEIKKLRREKETPDILYKIAKLQRDKNAYKDAIEILTKLVRTYPNSEIAPKAQYEIAEIYRENLHDKVKTREAYKTFLLIFPDHDLVDEVLRKLREEAQ